MDELTEGCCMGISPVPFWAESSGFRSTYSMIACRRFRLPVNRLREKELEEGKLRSGVESRELDDRSYPKKEI